MRAAAFVFWSVTGVYSKMAWRAQDIMHAIDSEGFLWGEDDAPVYDPSLRDAQLFDKREKGMSMSQAVRAVNESYENYSMDPGKSLNSYQVTDKQGIKNVPHPPTTEKDIHTELEDMLKETHRIIWNQTWGLPMHILPQAMKHTIAKSKTPTGRAQLKEQYKKDIAWLKQQSEETIPIMDLFFNNFDEFAKTEDGKWLIEVAGVVKPLPHIKDVLYREVEEKIDGKVSVVFSKKNGVLFGRLMRRYWDIAGDIEGRDLALVREVMNGFKVIDTIQESNLTTWIPETRAKMNTVQITHDKQAHSVEEFLTQGFKTEDLPDQPPKHATDFDLMHMARTILKLAAKGICRGPYTGRDRLKCKGVIARTFPVRQETKARPIVHPKDPNALSPSLEKMRIIGTEGIMDAFHMCAAPQGMEDLARTAAAPFTKKVAAAHIYEQVVRRRNWKLDGTPLHDPHQETWNLHAWLAYSTYATRRNHEMVHEMPGYRPIITTRDKVQAFFQLAVDNPSLNWMTVWLTRLTGVEHTVKWSKWTRRCIEWDPERHQVVVNRDLTPPDGAAIRKGTALSYIGAHRISPTWGESGPRELARIVRDIDDHTPDKAVQLRTLGRIIDLSSLDDTPYKDVAEEIKDKITTYRKHREGEPVCLESSAMGMGARHSIFGFGRYAEGIMGIAQYVFSIPVIIYIDDNITISHPELAEIQQELHDGLLDALGCFREHSKADTHLYQVLEYPAGPKVTALGVDYEHVGDTATMIYPKPKRMDKAIARVGQLCSDLADAHKSPPFRQGQKTVGSLLDVTVTNREMKSFAVHKRIYRHFTATERVWKGAMLSGPMRASLSRLIRAALANAILEGPKFIDPKVAIREVMWMMSDASMPDSAELLKNPEKCYPPFIGAVLFREGCPPLSFSIPVGIKPPKGRYDTAAFLTARERVYRRFGLNGNGAAALAQRRLGEMAGIFELEAIAVWTALALWHQELQRGRLVAAIDNTGVISAAAAGASSSKLASKVLTATNDMLARYDIHFAPIYVLSELNLGDAMTPKNDRHAALRDAALKALGTVTAGRHADHAKQLEELYRLTSTTFKSEGAALPINRWHSEHSDAIAGWKARALAKWNTGHPTLGSLAANTDRPDYQLAFEDDP